MVYVYTTHLCHCLWGWCMALFLPHCSCGDLAYDSDGLASVPQRSCRWIFHCHLWFPKGVYVYIYIHYTEYIIHQTYTNHIHIHIHTHLHIHIHIHIYMFACVRMLCVYVLCLCVSNLPMNVFEKIAWHNYNAIMPCDMTQCKIIKKQRADTIPYLFVYIYIPGAYPSPRHYFWSSQICIYLFAKMYI